MMSLSRMQRVMVIGCCGAGKSTFSKSLHELTGLEVIHLDQHYWKANWVETEPEIWQVKATELANRESWIIDGNYNGTMDIRIDHADTIIYLDYPTWRCLYRVIKRIWTYHGEVRPDMPPGCRERFDLKFLHYVATFNLIRRKSLIVKVERLSADKQVVMLNNDRQVQQYLNLLSGKISTFTKVE